MDYQKHYDLLVIRARSQNRSKLKRSNQNYIYYEKHHIIPRCMGGNDNKENLILLTAKEHFIAHQLLVKIYPKENKLIFALHRMSTGSNKQNVSKSRFYKWIREKNSLLRSSIPGPNAGKTLH